MDADETEYLPWNTAKNGMDEDSPTYRSLLQKMVTSMRSVIDWLNELKAESSALDRGDIEEAPLDEAIEKAKLINLLFISNERSVYGV